MTRYVAGIRRLIGGARRRLDDRRIDRALRQNFRPLTVETQQRLAEALAEHYHVGWRAPEAYSQDGYRRDVETHLNGRLTTFRTTSIPWLAEYMPLSGLRVLEVGCGTGSSTLALAEQGAEVTGIDVDLSAIEVGRRRLEIFGLDAELRFGNAADIGSEFAGRRFDLVLYFATLEHMTVPERLASLRQAWELLEPGGRLGVIEAPNRLWTSDVHTSQLPFFNWLPDELAFAYAPFSPRENFRELYGSQPRESMEHFLRRGRGVSYHEFELAIAPVDRLDVSEALAAYVRRRSFRRLPRDQRWFRRYLMRQVPKVPPAFFEEFLDLLVRKDSEMGASRHVV
jgi:2-polyprenyl-3-methyl-5-hydroxy-6-metoxy-1,4-benzoquinol methylase